MNRESYYETAEMIGLNGSDSYASSPTSRYSPMGPGECEPMGAPSARTGNMPSYYSEPGMRFEFGDLEKLLDQSH